MFEPASWKEEERASDFVASNIISPQPATMIRYKMHGFQKVTIPGEPDSCVAAYKLSPEDFALILKAHKWVTPRNVSAADKFHSAWPEYKGAIELYYYDVGTADDPDTGGHSTVMAVSKDHTKLVFDTRDAWARPFDKKE